MSDAVLRILRLQCEKSSEDEGDEVSMRLDGVPVWPAVGEREYPPMKSGQDIGFARDVLFHHADAVITLHDLDDLSADDHLGSISIPAGEAGTGEHTRDILGPESHYRLTYRVGKIEF